MSVLAYYFGWYAGAVYSNLLASAICVGVAWWRLHWQAEQHHVQALAQAAKHHAERLTQAVEHHEALKAHVTAMAAAQARAPKTLARKPPAAKDGERM